MLTAAAPVSQSLGLPLSPRSQPSLLRRYPSGGGATLAAADPAAERGAAVENEAVLEDACLDLTPVDQEGRHKAAMAWNGGEPPAWFQDG